VCLHISQQQASRMQAAEKPSIDSHLVTPVGTEVRARCLVYGCILLTLLAVSLVFAAVSPPSLLTAAYMQPVQTLLLVVAMMAMPPVR